MQQRVGLPQAVGFRTADHLEALMQVEAQGLRVLFIDVQALGIQFVDRIVQQALANPFATVLRCDEQHVHAPVGDPGEAADALAVLAADQHHCIEVATQHLVAQQDDVAIRQEVVGGAYRVLPHLYQFAVVTQARGLQRQYRMHAGVPP
ncbi:hypothetical protein D3C85_1421130 [compost metagenome]